MLGQNIDLNLIKYGALCLISVLAFIIILIFKLITGSYIIATSLFISIIWFAIYKIGIIIMYPGSSNYFKSDIQMRIGNQMAKNLYNLSLCFQFISQCIHNKQFRTGNSSWTLKQKIYGQIYNTMEMLSMFENSLSEKKTKILQILRKLLQEIQFKHSPMQNYPNSQQSPKSIAKFLQNPKSIRQVQSHDHQFLCQRIHKIIHLNKQFQQIIMSYKPPQGTLQFFKYRFFQQKLYEVRFGFQRWNHIFEYQVHLINNYGYTLQWYKFLFICKSAVIKRYRQNHAYYSNQNNNNGKYIMFCNPNGVFIQFFAVQNTYIREYLRQGYQIVLWNYRGYGQSTGTPSITKSQSDAMKVYNYFTNKGFNIQLVHGYSIGGVAAIGLASKLQRNQRQMKKKNQQISVSSFRPQINSNNLKLVIVDRSFSSIGDMAIEFGPTLHKLARIVFTFENKNLSKQFKQLKTQKLIIWDKKDEVIPDTASVKGGIFMEFFKNQYQSSCKTCTNCLKNDDQTTLNQEVSVLINQSDQQERADINEKFLKRFSNSIKLFLKNIRELEHEHTNEVNVNHEYDPTQLNQIIDPQKSLKSPFSEQIVEKILKVLQSIDGGGSYLPSSSANFKKILKSNSLIFQFKINSYLLGLVLYGSVNDSQMAFQDRNNIQIHTLVIFNLVFQKKIQKILKDFENISRQIQNTNNNIIEPQILNALQNVVKTFIQAKKLIEQNFLSQQYKKFGKLLACSNGHNGSLLQQQLNLLMKYISQICGNNQQLRQQLNQQQNFNVINQNLNPNKQMSLQMNNSCIQQFNQ